MEAKLSGRVNPMDLNNDTYPIYCQLYLIQNIYEIIPSTSLIEYRHVSGLIKLIPNVLYQNLNTETDKLLLLNKIYQLFMEFGVELSREYLYQLVSNLYNNLSVMKSNNT